LAVFTAFNILANYKFPLNEALGSSNRSLYHNYAMKLFALILTLLSFSSLAGVDLVKVDKSENKMYLLDNGKVIKEYHVAFGENPKGHKEQEGDEKTPEGTYTLDYKKRTHLFIELCILVILTK
jgi:murein L,D-transpeptidase YafK